MYNPHVCSFVGTGVVLLNISAGVALVLKQGLLRVEMGFFPRASVLFSSRPLRHLLLSSSVRIHTPLEETDRYQANC